MGKLLGPLPIETIVKFFAIALIVLGVIFFGEGTYGLFAVNFDNDAEIDNTIPKIEFLANDR